MLASSGLIMKEPVIFSVLGLSFSKLAVRVLQLENWRVLLKNDVSQKTYSSEIDLPMHYGERECRALVLVALGLATYRHTSV